MGWGVHLLALNNGLNAVGVKYMFVFLIVGVCGDGSPYPDDGLGSMGGNISGKVFPPEGAVGMGD